MTQRALNSLNSIEGLLPVLWTHDNGAKTCWDPYCLMHSRVLQVYTMLWGMGMHGLVREALQHRENWNIAILDGGRGEVHVSTATSGRLNWLGARNTGNTLFKSSDAHKWILESLSSCCCQSIMNLESVDLHCCESRIWLKIQNFPLSLLRWNEWKSEGK